MLGFVAKRCSICTCVSVLWRVICDAESGNIGELHGSGTLCVLHTDKARLVKDNSLLHYAA